MQISEAIHQYKQPHRRHKGRTVRKAAPGPTAGRFSGFCRDFSQAGAIAPPPGVEMADIGQHGGVTAPGRRIGPAPGHGAGDSFLPAAAARHRPSYRQHVVREERRKPLQMSLF
jgi:hypothetical protein